ncbi:hypothetical protein PITC_018250 [Penicillium italicum]|uniref:Uncharacterized protein n=1 Tax=Penicillium italicum TaxID=40296 RepID=A0A0A2LIN2_PENIT|nr:hypothetical protein PITC_018250 [Penicillium italicum]
MCTSQCRPQPSWDVLPSELVTNQTKSRLVQSYPRVSRLVSASQSVILKLF